MKHSYKIFSAVILLASIASVAHAQINTNISGTVAVPVVVPTVTGVVNTTVSSTSTTTVSPVEVNVGLNASANTNTNANTNDTVTASDAVMLSAPTVDTSSNTSVSVAYVHPAKLFGFISTNFTEKATVSTDAQGNVTVTVHKPWWALFASSSANSTAFEAAIKANVENQSLDAQGNLSVSEKTALATQIEAAAQATYSASAHVSTSAY